MTIRSKGFKSDNGDYDVMRNFVINTLMALSIITTLGVVAFTFVQGTMTTEKTCTITGTYHDDRPYINETYFETKECGLISTRNFSNADKLQEGEPYKMILSGMTVGNIAHPAIVTAKPLS